jgi:hypothetical protein
MVEKRAVAIRLQPPAGQIFLTYDISDTRTIFDISVGNMVLLLVAICQNIQWALFFCQ